MKQIVEIQRALNIDLPVLQELQQQFFCVREEQYRADTTAFHARNTPHNTLTENDLSEDIIFIAKTEDQQPMGYIRGSIGARSNYKYHTLGSLDELFVLEEGRGKGIAQQLIHALEEEFRTQGCDHMVTHTDDENLRAQKCYKNAGMIPVTMELWKPLT